MRSHPELLVLPLVLLFASSARAADVGVLEITSDPPGVTILLDGTDLGKTPIVLDEVRVGKHRLRAAMPDYGSAEVVIEVRKDEVTQVPLKLEKQRSTGTVERKPIILKRAVGRLLVLSDPIGLPVFLEGEQKGKTSLSLKDVSVGRYSLRVGNMTRRIRIEPGRTTKVKAISGDNAIYDMEFLKKRKELPTLLQQAAAAETKGELVEASQLYRKALSLLQRDDDRRTSVEKSLDSLTERLPEWAMERARQSESLAKTDADWLKVARAYQEAQRFGKTPEAAAGITRAMKKVLEVRRRRAAEARRVKQNLAIISLLEAAETADRRARKYPSSLNESASQGNARTALYEAAFAKYALAIEQAEKIKWHDKKKLFDACVATVMCARMTPRRNRFSRCREYARKALSLDADHRYRKELGSKEYTHLGGGTEYTEHGRYIVRFLEETAAGKW